MEELLTLAVSSFEKDLFQVTKQVVEHRNLQSFTAGMAIVNEQTHILCDFVDSTVLFVVCVFS
mgnify:CR=1 FL=1